jgi:NAD(P)-dependent dehydrogenase (short-subunit alcohol dehydrogenase family)
MRLKDQVAIVTGGSRGIGRGTLSKALLPKGQGRDASGEPGGSGKFGRRVTQAGALPRLTSATSPTDALKVVEAVKLTGAR